MIKAANIEDLDQLSILFNEYRIFYKKTSDLAGAKKFLLDRMTNSESIILVIEKKDVLVGFVQLYPLFSSTNMKRLWLLNDLYVTSSHRGKGLSKKLIERSKALCRKTNAHGLMLETEKSNEIGNKLYPRVGFELDVYHNHYFWSVD